MLSLRAGPYDPTTRVLTRASGPVRLSPTEARLLAHLAAAPGQAFSKDDLLVDVWGYQPGVRSRTLFSTIDRLRKKVEVDPGSPDHIVTVEGGYAFVDRTPLTVSDDLVGRQADAEATAAALSAPGARVLLAGPGGVGKTRLAAELTAALVPGTLPRAIRVDLAGLSTQEAVLHAIARALDLKGQDATLRIPRALSARAPVLLVLDDLDHLADARPASATALFDIGGGADVRVLATCREHLSAPWLTVVPLAPLTTAAARTLLARRAAALGLPPTRADTALQQLGEALDRLPLALELAASWLPLLPADVLLARLDELTGLSGTGARPDHHRSLQACVAWSLDLLSDTHRTALARVAAWSVPLPADAIACLLADLGMPLALVAELKRRSLVQVGPDGSVRMLATVRRGVAPDVGCAARLSPWLDALLDLADALRHGPRHAEVMATLDAASTLVLEVLDALPCSTHRARQVARWVPLQVRFGLDPGASRRVRDTRASVADDTLLALELDLAQQLLERRLGRPDARALEALRSRAPESSPLFVETSLELGIVLRMAGRAHEARPILEGASTHPTATDVQKSRAQLELANLARRQGRLEDAHTLLEAVAAAAKQRRDPWTRMLAAGARGSVARQAGEFLTAETHQRRALALARELHEWDNAAHLAGNLANVLMAVGEYAEALRSTRAALAHYRSHGHLRSEAYALQTEAGLRLFQGQVKASMQLAEEALEGFRGADDTHGAAYVSAFLVALTLGHGAPEAALRRAKRSSGRLPEGGAAGQLPALGYIASVFCGAPDPHLRAAADQHLPARPCADALRAALDRVHHEPDTVVAWLRDPHWVHASLW